MASMPKLPVDTMCAGLTDLETEMVCAAFNRRTGCLRASKPYRKIDGCDDLARFHACANYVWRMLCFDFVGQAPHNCMPVTADWDIGMVYYRREERGDYINSDDRRADEKAARDEMNALIKRVESVLPITAQRGVMQWGRALGMIS